MSDKCPHMRFQSTVSVARLTETEGGPVTKYAADVKIHCVDCGTPFEWIGVPGGYSPGYPCVSADGFELRAPIRPSGLPVEKDPNKVYN